MNRSLAVMVLLLGLGVAAEAHADPADVGCSDNSREGFTDAASYPNLAACGGAWNVPGAFHDGPQCGRAAGNDGTNEAGNGCNVEDLCAEGWHVCYGPDDIDIRTGGRGCADAVSSSYPNNGTGQTSITHPPGAAFFMTRTSGSGTGNCDEVVNGFPQSFNDIFGCGNMGSTPQANCAPLNRFGHNQCQALHATSTQDAITAQDHGYTSSQWAWECNDGAGGTNESKFVVKTRPDDQGGVLCCRTSGVGLPEVCDGLDNNANDDVDETDFDHDGQVDDHPGDACTQTNGQPGTIQCTGVGGWTCGPVPPQACCSPSGACANQAPSFCQAAGGIASGVGSTCGTMQCPQPASASVAGRVWHDLDRDGLEDAGEPGIPGVVVHLGARTATTGANGAYSFTALTAGSYSLVVDASDPILAAGGFTATIVYAGSDPAIYSEPSPRSLTLAQGQAVGDLDYGFVGGCLATSAPGTSCDDHNACTAPDTCSGATCAGAAIDCNDDNPCTDDACGASGCTHTNNTAACDDGSACTGGDVCAAGVCSAGATNLCPPSCPNGQLDLGETCDDGNMAPGDGCDAACQKEYDYPCIGLPVFCVGCGNGTLETGEQCDDGNHVAGDGCDVSCQSEDPCFGTVDVDGDGVCDNVDDCLDNDGDHYGVGAGCLGPDCNDAIAACNVDCITDLSGGDGDGIPDCEQPQCDDFDGDGYGEGEGCAGADCDDGTSTCTTDCSDNDGDQLPNCVDADDDNDTISDEDELALGTNPLEADTDGDGLSDIDELAVLHTDPRVGDSDHDGVSDGEEIAAGHDPLDPSDGDDGSGSSGSSGESAGCGAGASAGLGLALLALFMRRRMSLAR